MSRSWLLAAILAALGSAGNALAQTASCNITYTWPTWVGGNGFGASIDIRNTGAAITNGWSLVFNFPNGQQLQNGWPVTFSQSGSTLTATSTQAWSNSIPTNGVFNVAFNGTFSGANNPPTAFTLNGTACTIGTSTNTPPTVSVTSPTANQNFASGAAVPLAANASDPGGAVARVEFRVDGNLVNSDTSSPYSFSATGLANGTHSVTATAVDNGTPALSATSAAVTFTVGTGGNTAPQVSLTSPTANQNFASGAAVPLAATASDPGGAVLRVEFRVDGNLVNSDTSSPYSFSATGLANGTHTATATAVDNGSPALSTTTSTVTFTVGAGGNTPPQVSVTSPTANQSFPSGTAVTLAATASDPGGAVLRCEFRVDGVLVATDTTAPYSFNMSGLAVGAHSLVVTCFDNGNPSLSTATSPRAFTVTAGNTPPTVSLTSPTAGQSFSAGAAVPLAATASDPGGAVVRVDFRLDGSTTVVGSDMTSPYTFTANGVAAGSHTVTATAVDNGSPALSTTSAPVSFTVGAQGAVFRVNPQGRITKNGTVFPVRCGSWFGLEGRHEPSDDPVNPSGAAMEQYIGNTSWVNGGQGSGRTIAQTMTEIANMGINVIRLPLVPQTLNANDPQGTGNVLKNHSSVRIANSRLALETMIRAADTANIEVMLDVHSCSNYIGWRAGRFDARPPWVDADRDNYDFTRENFSCAASGNPSTVTTTHPYSAAQWLQTLQTVAGLGTQLGVDNIIGIDIFNEPHDYTWAEWKGFTEQAYTAINAVNPNTLLFVQGIGTNAGTQDGTPATITPVPHGSDATNPNWGENLFQAGGDPPNVPRERLVYSPHTYGPSVFVQKMFMDPAQANCTGLEGDAAGDANCNIVINPTLLQQGWEEHFGYLRQLNYAIVVGEFGGNMDWPLGQASIRDRDRWSHITPGVDTTWQNAFVDYMISKGIEGCYWSINPESGDTAGWYGHAYDPISNESGWGEWRPFDQRKTNLLNRLWGR
jgi:endoglucanase